ncbi:ankyrin repeat-containing domain protein [Spinellus fusiger]|nr:ankyrin repeat-containing domain protein [Spinellus fusiger]
MADSVMEDVMYCSRYGEWEELKEIKPSPEVYVQGDESGNTALHMASANNHVQIVELILEQLSLLSLPLVGLVNSQNKEGNTPLHWAALNGHLDVVQLLVKAGADCKTKNEAGRTPIYEAQQHNHEKVAEFFLLTMIEEAPEEPTDEDEECVETGAGQ